MSKLQARYIPIGSKKEEVENTNIGKSLKEIEQEAKNKKQREVSGLGKVEEPTIKPLGLSGKKHKEPQSDIQPLLQKNNEQPEANSAPISKESEDFSNEIELEDDFLPDLDDDFLEALSFIEEEVERGIASGEIKLLVTNADVNLSQIQSSLEVLDEIDTDINYEIKDEKKIQYSKEKEKVAKKLDKLEQSIDYEQYQNELMLTEFEDRQLRVNRYQKVKLEGMEELGIKEKNHNTDEKNVDIGLKRTTENHDKVERRAFNGNYEGNDLEDVDSKRDQIEAQIVGSQKKKGKKNKKSEEEKIAEAKERLRKKQEKRRAKANKKSKSQVNDIDELDMVGNQFDVNELREERMDRLLEIKKISAKKKELQKEKEKQRSKATKEFYKYKKVNKKSHIVGFKQQ